MLAMPASYALKSDIVDIVDINSTFSVVLTAFRGGLRRPRPFSGDFRRRCAKSNGFLSNQRVIENFTGFRPPALAGRP
ncbi:MAG: hypothetical protein ACK4FK_11540 [Ferrovibrio sp.]|jgi:hypothetical protein